MCEGGSAAGGIERLVQFQLVFLVEMGCREVREGGNGSVGFVYACCVNASCGLHDAAVSSLCHSVNLDIERVQSAHIVDCYFVRGDGLFLLG